MEFKNKKLEEFEKNIKNKKVAVIGVGVSNIPLIDYLYSKKAKVTIFDDKEEEKKCIISTLHYAKVAMVMLHSVAPAGINNLADYLGVSKDIFTWDRINEPIYNFFETKEHHKPKFIEARFDFFKKHPSQLVAEKEE